MEDLQSGKEAVQHLLPEASREYFPENRQILQNLTSPVLPLSVLFLAEVPRYRGEEGGNLEPAYEVHEKRAAETHGFFDNGIFPHDRRAVHRSIPTVCAYVFLFPAETGTAVHQ